MRFDDVKTIAVIGAGIIGNGIALTLGMAGYQLKLNSTNETSLQKGIDVIKADLDRLVELNPSVYEFSDIDTRTKPAGPDGDRFVLSQFEAKSEPVPTMLTQCHVDVIHGFLGQTTGFRPNLIKQSAIILGVRHRDGAVKYLHGTFGTGTFTFYGGHDPEDYQHAVGEAPTRLDDHASSPGYRLILNSLLIAARQN